MFEDTPDIPSPIVTELDDPQATEGEVIALPISAGRTFSLLFTSPYEAYLRLEGQRVVQDDNEHTRQLLMWQGRHLTSLFRTLGLHFGVRGILNEGDVVVTDLFDRDRGLFVDHIGLRQRLLDTGVQLPSFAVLGPTATRAELSQRLRSIFASGTAVEIRNEEAGRVSARRQVHVGRF